MHHSEEHILEILKRVTDRFPDDVTLENFHERVLSGEIQVFPIGDRSVMVGQAYGNVEVLILAAAGILQDILDYEPVFCQFYRERGFKMVRMCGRVGWAKYLPAMGYVPGDYETSMVKSLELH